MTHEPILSLEDSHLDILGKAQRGLVLGDVELCDRAGVSAGEFESIRAGEILLEPVGRLAMVLNLSPWALVNAARKAWRPQAVAVAGLKTFTTQYEDMTVNSYLIWDQESKKAVVFDSGADAVVMLDFAAANGLEIELVLITHTHGDHIADLERLINETEAPVYVGDREPQMHLATAFAAGKTFTVDSLTIETRLTWGHAEGGITYFVKGLSRPVAIVGDAIFAGSMGGGKVSYADALRTTRDEILSLPDETILAPGHGPLTTVGEEKNNNPFFTA